MHSHTQMHIPPTSLHLPTLMNLPNTKVFKSNLYQSMYPSTMIPLKCTFPSLPPTHTHTDEQMNLQDMKVQRSNLCHSIYTSPINIILLTHTHTHLFKAQKILYKLVPAVTAIKHHSSNRHLGVAQTLLPVVQ